MVSIKIIVGSTRPGRFGIQPAEWLMQLTEAHKDDAHFELIDLTKVNLPLLDEELPAAYDQYQNPHTKEWANIIGEADGFVFVTPEYNHSYAPALKNAIDYLAKEWNNKPVSFVSYGAEAGGTRAVEHLRAAVAWLKMYDLKEQVILPHYYTNLDDQGKYKFDEKHTQKAHDLLKELIFWSQEMKSARQKLQTA